MRSTLSTLAIVLTLAACTPATTDEQKPTYGFDHNGTLVQNEPGLTPAAWYVKYKDETNQDMTIRVVFDDKSKCATAGTAASACDRSIFKKGLNVHIGGTPLNGMIRVDMMEILP